MPRIFLGTDRHPRPRTAPPLAPVPPRRRLRPAASLLEPPPASTTRGATPPALAAAANHATVVPRLRPLNRQVFSLSPPTLLTTLLPPPATPAPPPVGRRPEPLHARRRSPAPTHDPMAWSPVAKEEDGPSIVAVRAAMSKTQAELEAERLQAKAARRKTEAARDELVHRVAALTLEERQEAARQEAERLDIERREAAHAEEARIAAARREEARAAAYAAQVAAATAALHSQAVAVLNIKALVPITLDLASPNFPRWRALFVNTLEKYALTNHVFEDDDFSDDICWKRMDATVLSWFYGTITPELLDVVFNHEEGPPTARRLWLALEEQFVGYRETRALHLDV